MGFFEGLKNLFFRKRKDDKRNEPKHLKVVHKPSKPPRNLAKARKLAKKKGRGYERSARRRWCPGSIIPAALRPTVSKEELEKHMPHWYKRQLRQEALRKAFSPPRAEGLMTAEQRTAAVQKAFGPEDPHGEPVILAAGPPMPPEVQKMLDPLAPENQPKCIQPSGTVRKEPGE